MTKYNKLVRDSIPEIIESSGKRCKYRVAGRKEYGEKLMEKLNEEVQEFFLKPNVEELADIQEVVDAIASYNAWNVYGTVRKKYRTKGAFYRRYILEEVMD